MSLLLLSTVTGVDEVVSPSPVTAVGRTVAPTVVLGSVVVTPAPSTAIGRTAAPTVLGGSVVVTPAPATAIGRTVAPTILGGTVLVSPAPASAVGRVGQPTVIVPLQFGPRIIFTTGTRVAALLGVPDVLTWTTGERQTALTATARDAT